MRVNPRAIAWVVMCSSIGWLIGDTKGAVAGVAFATFASLFLSGRR